MDKAALYKLTGGLYVVGVEDEGRRVGCVINTAIQVTSKPAQVSITVSKDNYTHEVLMRTKHCTVSVVAQEISMDVIGRFGFQSGRDVVKFDGIPHQVDAKGAPHLIEKISSWFSGDIVNTVDVGSHTIFIIAVEEGEVTGPNNEPMTYAYYRTVKNGTSPKNAPTHVEEEHKPGWKCSVCGYVHEGDELPEDFTCPICRQPRSVFVKQ